MNNFIELDENDDKWTVGLRKVANAQYKKKDPELICLLFNVNHDVVEVGSKSHEFSSRMKAMQRNSGAMGYLQEFSFHLSQMPLHVHQIYIIVRSDPRAKNRGFKPFTLEAASIVDLSVGNYKGNVVRSLFALEYVKKYHGKENLYHAAKIQRQEGHQLKWKMEVLQSDEILVDLSIKSIVFLLRVRAIDAKNDESTKPDTSMQTIEGICGALHSDDFPALEAWFPDDGLPQDEFVRVLLHQFLKTRSSLRHKEQAMNIAKLLYDLFEQIDINEDGNVDWDEFTNFCVMIGMVSTNQQQISKQVDLIHESYQQLKNEELSNFNGGMVKTMAWLKDLHRIVVVYQCSSRVAIYDTECTYMHDFEAIDKSLDHDDSACVVCLEQFTCAGICYIAVATTNRFICFWTVINAFTGVYVHQFRISTNENQVLLRWNPTLERLIATGASHVLSFWNITNRTAETFPSIHRDYVTDSINIPDHCLMLTASLDRKIAVWRTVQEEHKDSQVKFLHYMKGHKKGIRQIDYYRNIIVSCGFEHDVYCWYVPSKKPSLILSGHKESLLGAYMLKAEANPIIIRCLTGDVSGKFKVWDISRCSKSARSVAALLQVFHYNPRVASVSSSNNVSVKLFCCSDLVSSESISASFNDVIACDPVGLFRFQVKQNKQDLEPIRNLVYNSVGNNFTGSVKRDVVVWNARNGIKEINLLHVNDTDITCLAYAQPRQRKLFVGLEDGKISVHNPVNGFLMTEESTMHTDAVVSIKYCKDTQCIITASRDRSICVARDSPGKIEIDVLRRQRHAHPASITCAAYSFDMSIVASGDSSGNIRVWNFYSLAFEFECVGHKGEINQLLFVESYPLLISCDVFGEVFIWQMIEPCSHTFSAKCIVSLCCENSDGKVGTRKPTTFVTADASIDEIDDNRPSITALATVTVNGRHLIAASDENGFVLLWNFDMIIKEANTRGCSAYFKPLEATWIQARKVGQYPFKIINSTYGAKPNTPSRDSVVSLFIMHHFLVWRAHSEGILGMIGNQSRLFTASHDLSARCWDSQKNCLGVLYADESCATNDKCPSSWKMGDVFNSEYSTLHTKVASEILSIVLKHKTFTTQTKPTEKDSTIDDTLLSSHDTSDSKERIRRGNNMSQLHSKCVAKEIDMQLSEKMENIHIMACKQQAFTYQSLHSGQSLGYFKGEEQLALHLIVKNPLGTERFKSRPISPLLQSDDQLRKSNSTGQQPRLKNLGELNGSVLRTCENYAAERLDRDAAKVRIGICADMNLSAPSPFLLKHLPNEMNSPSKSPKRLQKPLSIPKPSNSSAANVRREARTISERANNRSPKRKSIKLPKVSSSPEKLRSSSQLQLSRKLALATGIYDTL